MHLFITTLYNHPSDRPSTRNPNRFDPRHPEPDMKFPLVVPNWPLPARPETDKPGQFNPLTPPLTQGAPVLLGSRGNISLVRDQVNDCLNSTPGGSIAIS